MAGLCSANHHACVLEFSFSFEPLAHGANILNLLWKRCASIMACITARWDVWHFTIRCTAAKVFVNQYATQSFRHASCSCGFWKRNFDPEIFADREIDDWFDWISTPNKWPCISSARGTKIVATESRKFNREYQFSSWFYKWPFRELEGVAWAASN